MQTIGANKPDTLEGVIFIGTVVANDDSQAADGLRRQRIKVTIPGVLDEADGYTLDTLPWCTPKAGVGDYGKVAGEVDVPSIGNTVSVEFQDGRIEYPHYSPGAVDTDPPAELQINYPFRRGRVLANGAFYWVDESSGEMTYFLANGYKVFVDSVGSVIMTVPQDMTINVGRNVLWTVGGNYELQVVGNYKVTIGGTETVATKGNRTLTVGGDSSEVVTGKVLYQAKGDMTLLAATPIIINPDATIGGIRYLGHKHGGVATGASQTLVPS